jgi:hypothetical protein
MVMASISDYVPSIRLVVINENGDHPEIIGGYVRFKQPIGPVSDDIICNLDVQTGYYNGGYSIFADHKEKVDYHPLSHQRLEGQLENFETLLDIVRSMGRYISCLEYLGYDFAYTDEGYKLMEINTHPSIRLLQIFHPLLFEGRTKEYFEKKIRSMND